jgi:hypothetical protein
MPWALLHLETHKRIVTTLEIVTLYAWFRPRLLSEDEWPTRCEKQEVSGLHKKRTGLFPGQIE